MEKLTDYELKRLENIRRNNKRLAALNLPSMAAQGSASTKRPRCVVVPDQVDPNQHTTVMTRKGKEQKRAANTSLPESCTRAPPDDIPNESTDDDEEVEEQETEATGLEIEATKRKGRGLAKGDKGYGNNAQVFRKRFITSDAARSIWPLFKTEITSPFVTWKEYIAKSTSFDRLFKLWRNKKFQFDCSEGELKDAFRHYIKNNYRQWMSEIRKSVFSKHKTAAARYANNPSYVIPEIWTQMVDKWLKREWQDVSEQNAINRDKLTMVHTTGSVPMAKYIKEEIDRTGVEPSPIEMFRRFHVSTPKDGKPEHWKSEKAKDLYESMELKKKIDEALGGDELDDWDIYKEEVLKEPKCGKTLGLGGGMEPPEAVCGSSSSQTCNKHLCLEREEEFGQVKHKVESLTDEVADLKQLIQVLLARESTSSLGSSNSPTIAPISKSTHGDYEACAP